MKYISVILFCAVTTFNTCAQEACEFTESQCRILNNYDKADVELNRTYKQIMTMIDKDEYRNYRVEKTEIKSSLLRAQRAWLKFRDENCHAYYTLFSGGTSRNTDHLICLTQVTQDRTEYLQNIYVNKQDMGI